MKKKVFAVFSTLVLGSAGMYKMMSTKVEANTCEELEHKILGLPEQQACYWFLSEYSSKCKNLDKYVKCWTLKNGMRCMDGRLFGPQEGGKKTCTREPSSKICPWHQ